MRKEDAPWCPWVSLGAFERGLLGVTAPLNVTTGCVSMSYSVLEPGRSRTGRRCEALSTFFGMVSYTLEVLRFWCEWQG